MPLSLEHSNYKLEDGNKIIITAHSPHLFNIILEVLAIAIR